MSVPVMFRNNEEASRYEAVVGDEVAGFAEYMLYPGVIVFPHTVVESKFEGQGIGSRLARYALDDVRARGDLRVRPLCPFIKKWIETHPDYQDLVD